MVFGVVALLAELLRDAVLGMVPPRRERLERVELDHRQPLAVLGLTVADPPEARHRRNDLEQLPGALAVLLEVDVRREPIAKRDDDHCSPPLCPDAAREPRVTRRAALAGFGRDYRMTIDGSPMCRATIAENATRPAP